MLSDGGANYQINFASVVQKCREYVDKDEDIVIDLVSAWNYQSPKPGFEVSDNAYTNFKRARDIRKHQRGDDDVVEFLGAFPNVTFRYYIRPTTPYTTN